MVVNCLGMELKAILSALAGWTREAKAQYEDTAL